MFRDLYLVPCIVMISICALACQESRDPQTPDGALRLFGVALEESDKALIKASLSLQTNQALSDILVTLQKIDSEIKRFPSPKAQEWARSNALGTSLAKFLVSSNSDALWTALVEDRLKWATEQPSGSVEQGLSPRRVISGSEGEGTLTLLTRSDNKVSLRREGPRWVVTSFEEPLSELHKTLKKSLKALPVNREEWIRRDRLDLVLPTE